MKLEIKKSFVTFGAFFKKILYPSVQKYPDELQREVIYRRTKAFVIVKLCSAILFSLFRLFFSSYFSTPIILAIISAILSITFRILTAKTRQYEFEIIYSIYFIVRGPLFIYIFEESIFATIAISLSAPLLIYLLSGSKLSFMLQVVGQIFFLGTIGKKSALTVLHESGNHNFLDNLMLCLIIGQILISIIVFQSIQINQAIYGMASLAKARREETERQKNFLLSFSHEIRNALNFLLGNIDISILETTCQNAKIHLKNARHYGKLLLMEVNNIFDSGKIEVNELELTLNTISTKSFIKKFWLLAEEMILRKKLKTRLLIHKSVPAYVKLDETRLHQILFNILNHSLKHTETGTIDIIFEWFDSDKNNTLYDPSPFDEDGFFDKNLAFIHLDRNFICVYPESSSKCIDHLQFKENSQRGGFSKVTIKDSSVGLNEDALANIFNKGDYLAGSRDNNAGIALGLFVSKKIVEKFNGNLMAYSKMSKGTAFVVCLPVDSEVPNVLQETYRTLMPSELSELELVPTQPKIINFMIVDDEPFNITILTKYVTSLGGCVKMTASDGDEAVGKYIADTESNKTIDIITMDLNMPRMDGKAALEQIRRYEEKMGFKSCPVIIISANCTKSEIEHCTDKKGTIRADAFLKKPIILDEFKETIKRVKNV